MSLPRPDVKARPRMLLCRAQLYSSLRGKDDAGHAVPYHRLFLRQRTRVNGSPRQSIASQTAGEQHGSRSPRLHTRHARAKAHARRCKHKAYARSTGVAVHTCRQLQFSREEEQRRSEEQHLRNRDKIKLPKQL